MPLEFKTDRQTRSRGLIIDSNTHSGNDFPSLTEGVLLSFPYCARGEYLMISYHLKHFSERFAGWRLVGEPWFWWGTFCFLCAFVTFWVYVCLIGIFCFDKRGPISASQAFKPFPYLRSLFEASRPDTLFPLPRAKSLLFKTWKDSVNRLITWQTKNFLIVIEVISLITLVPGGKKTSGGALPVWQQCHIF